jgi:hypothetical protein
MSDVAVVRVVCGQFEKQTMPKRRRMIEDEESR